MTFGSHILALKRAPVDHDTQACCLGPKMCHILFQHFYRIQGLFIICAPDTNVTENSHSYCSWTAGHKKTQKETSFNFVKVRCSAIWYLTPRNNLAENNVGVKTFKNSFVHQKILQVTENQCFFLN